MNLYYYYLKNGVMFTIEFKLAPEKEVELHKDDGPGLKKLFLMVNKEWKLVWFI